MGAAELLLGVDGGGSKTRALVADRDLRVLGVGAAGSSNVQVVGLAGVAAAVSAAAAAALRAAAAGAQPLAVCLGLAGVGRAEQRGQVAGWAAGAFGGAPCAVVTDIELVLAAGAPAGWGLALIAGTGSACLGRAPGGASVKVGGWGFLLGDEGSGYDLARRALRLATQAADGRADAERLLRAVLAHYDLPDADGLVARVYTGDTAPAAIAALAAPVVALAEAGDPQARALLDESAAALAHMGVTAARRLGLAGGAVALGGGLLGSSPYLRARLDERLGPAWSPMTYVDDPARGALVLARRLLNPPGAADGRAP